MFPDSRFALALGEIRGLVVQFKEIKSGDLLSIPGGWRRRASPAARLRVTAPALVFVVWGLAFGVLGLGFGVWGLGFGVWSLGCGVQDLGLKVWGLRFTVEG